MRLCNLKKRVSKKGGFTLVEVIVVLVILAILAALLIPSLTSYIDKANQKVLVTEARSALMGAQSLVGEKYALNVNVTDYANDSSSSGLAAEAKIYSQVPGTLSSFVITGGTITSFKYTNGTKSVTYNVNAAEKFTFS